MTEQATAQQVLGNSERATALFAHYRHWFTQGLLPRPGGVMAAQPPLFAWLIDYCAAVHGAYVEREMKEAEEQERIRQANERARRPGG